jgi:hypothetical protein
VDKSRIPAVIRKIGAFSVAAGCAQHGAASLSDGGGLVGAGPNGEASEKEDWETLFKRLASDSRSQVRSQAAQAAVAWWPTAGARAFAVIGALAADPALEVRAAAVRSLVTLLESASLPERIEHVCEWATSEDVAKRSAIAAALREPISVMVADLAIEQLARDTEPLIRRAALEAARSRLREDPQTYSRMIRELMSDPDRQIRHAAEQANNAESVLA